MKRDLALKDWGTQPAQQIVAPTNAIDRNEEDGPAMDFRLKR